MHAKAPPIRLPVFVFDFGGVLIKWKNNDPIFDYVARRYGIPVAPMRRELEAALPGLETGQVTMRECLEAALGKFGKRLREGDSPDALWTLPFERLMKPRKGALKVVESLRRRGYRAYMFSNTSPPHAAYLRRTGWTEIVDGFVASCEIGSMKPSAEAFSRALREIGARASDVVFIDDREANVRGAEAYGIRRALRFTSVARLKRDVDQALRLDWQSG
ncbi:MAG: HAD family phosphatase [Nitrososphaerota archaeon]|jgi:FMN phosphatase YigB (HAD superfamily)|nr:HAD family phosphatase [Nitrososphaerota archaeon]MDG6966583.1 HAD family phosphatase [Nitrososphaerota archaeon]MDG6978558.1 HAD family phosphatase [Nitrososphaerota archaeon]